MVGFINLIKPENMSSAYVVGGVKYTLKTPCGHMGTLDPMASGVLPIGLGKASRLFPYMLDKEKTYEAVFKFGLETDTLDRTGVTLRETNVIPTKSDIEKVLNNFIGDISQIPPKYSAKCVDGKRGYELARKGVDFSLQAKTITVLDIKVKETEEKDQFKFTIKCKGGTYIRSLARDIGYAVGSLGTMTALCRTQSGIFTLENGVAVADFKSDANPLRFIIPADEAVNFPKLILTGKQAQRILDGVFENYGFNDGIYRVYNQDAFIGVGRVSEGVLRINSYVR